MTWSDIPKNPTPRVLRQFAGAWLVFFLAWGAHQYLARGRHQLGLALGVAAVMVGVVGLVWPRAVRALFVGWMVLAFPVGWVVSQAMLLVMYYLVLTPLALLFRVRGRDVLARRPAPKQRTFWTPKPMPQDVRSYFNQY